VPFPAMIPSEANGLEAEDGAVTEQRGF